MSLLEELKKKARESEKPTQEEDNSERKEALFGPIIRPRLHYIQGFFQELSDTLNRLEREDRFDFKLTNTASLDGLVQRNFSCYIEKNKKQEISEVNFKHELLGNRDYNITCRSAPEAELLKKILTDRSIRYQTSTESRSSVVFKIKPKINCRFSFTPDFNSGLIILKITNYDGTWDQTLKFRPDKINDELLDEIGKYALHEENTLMEMTGNRLSITMRERLQQKLGLPVKKKKLVKKKRVAKKKKKISILGMITGKSD